ncbi:hypothetical protein [Lactobacillus bombicola]|uniref:hypothetical protein n=1 Tax=Lactobacillus bombicola TaxID=1505723 RepID=UPI000E5751C2|nr:hypothetical protein [Lactobacillus bombicola]RHW48445.1 hypothetical protein DS833_07920 [Lactobacillus bombicola]
MNKKTQGHILSSVLVIIFYCILIFVSCKSSDSLSEKIACITSFLGTLFAYAYNNFNIIFILCRKILAFILNDTVSVNNAYKIFLKSDFSLEKIKEEFENKCNEKLDIEKVINNFSDQLTLEINSKGIISNVDIKCINDTENYLELVLNVKASTSYRDSKKVTKLFFALVSIVDNLTPKLYDIQKNEGIKLSNPLFTSTIQMEKYNPFYRYVVKYTSLIKDTNFKKLDIEKDNDTKIQITNHKMKITTNNIDNLQSILKDYISISTIG